MIQLKPLYTHNSGSFDEGAAEIAAYDAQRQQIFVTNAQQNTVDILNISTPSNLTLVDQISLAAHGAGVNSVAVHNGVVAIAVEANSKQDPGQVVFFDNQGTYLNAVTVGALPDMVTFTPDGTKVLVANEGEPSSYQQADSIDPYGSVSIIDISAGVNNAQVKTADFRRFNFHSEQVTASGIRIFGPDANIAQDLEPEYIAVASDSSTAWVSLQENNALAVVDLNEGRITDILPLGYKDLSLRNNAFDASNEDNSINITHWENVPLYSMYQPDAISTYIASDNQTYIVTANEGDSRADYPGFDEEARITDLSLDATAFPNAAELQAESNLGRLKVTNTLGDSDNDGDYDALYTFGGRSFSIWDTQGNLVFDSGDDFERIIAKTNPENFNSTNDENGSFDDRSDDKGPEPEAITIGEVGGQTYGFIGLERDSGIMVYDITNPTAVKFVQYINNRNFNVDAQLSDGTSNPEAGDLGPEGLVFISAEDSPNGQPILVVANEISGTTTTYSVETVSPRAVNPMNVPASPPWYSSFSSVIFLLGLITVSGIRAKR
ncbi:MAG: choice-of-anchor I family protein [Cyanobacteria bacterium P01_F01_bin.116]